MNFIALKMLIGDRAKYIGIVMGLTFASLLITQQMAIFIGLIARTYTSITDLGLPDVWVCDSQSQFIDDIKPAVKACGVVFPKPEAIGLDVPATLDFSLEGVDASKAEAGAPAPPVPVAL